VLVPLSQSEQVTYESVRHCEQVGFSQVCSIEQIPNKVNVEEEVGIRVIEVMSIEEALGYLIY
jgi:predicted S18 family serine protease